MKKENIFIARVLILFFIFCYFLTLKISPLGSEFYFMLPFFIFVGLAVDLFIKSLTEESLEIKSNYRKLSIIFLLNSIALFELSLVSSDLPFILVVLLFYGLLPAYYLKKKKLEIKYHLFFYLLGLLSLFVVTIILAQSHAHYTSGNSGRIKAAMDQFRSNAEVYKLNNGSYGALISINRMKGKDPCVSVDNSLISDGTDGKVLCDDIRSQGEGAFTLHSSPEAYCIQKVLPALPDVIWCIDSKGNVGSTLTKCDGIDYSCQ